MLCVKLWLIGQRCDGIQVYIYTYVLDLDLWIYTFSCILPTHKTEEMYVRHSDTQTKE